MGFPSLYFFLYSLYLFLSSLMFSFLFLHLLSCTFIFLLAVLWLPFPMYLFFQVFSSPLFCFFVFLFFRGAGDADSAENLWAELLLARDRGKKESRSSCLDCEPLTCSWPAVPAADCPGVRSAEFTTNSSKGEGCEKHTLMPRPVQKLFTDINCELSRSGLLVKAGSHCQVWEFGAFGTFFRHAALQANYFTFFMQRWRSLDALSYHPGAWGLWSDNCPLWTSAVVLPNYAKGC